MDPAWVMVMIGAAGILGQWMVGAKREGARNEKIEAHDRRLQKHGEELDEVRKDITGHAVKIAAIEGQVAAGRHAGR